VSKIEKAFLEKANKIYEGKYDYSKMVYVSSKAEIIVVCPLHGEYTVLPGSHVHKTYRSHCPECMKIDRVTKNKNKFLEEARLIHGDRYDYSEMDYSGIANTKVNINCKLHGSISILPSNHLRGMGGCNKCAIAKTSKDQTRSIEDYISEANDIHNNKYDYSRAVYINNKTKLEVVCPLHGSFLIRADSHVKSSQSGCPSCATYGFDPIKKGTLYYLSVNDGEAYKIGITNYTVEKRYSATDMETIKVLKTWDFAVGADAYRFEQLILKKFSMYKYTGLPLLGSGNTELFHTDIGIVNISDVLKDGTN